MQKLVYSLNHEMQEKLVKEKEDQEKRRAEEEIRMKVEREKKETGNQNMFAISLKNAFLSKIEYMRQRENDLKKWADLKELAKKCFLYRAVQAYKVLQYTKDISKAITHYCVDIYFEMIRKKKARRVFDDIDSDSPTPDGKGRKVKGLFSRRFHQQHHQKENAWRQIPKIQVNKGKVPKLAENHELIARQQDRIHKHQSAKQSGDPSIRFIGFHNMKKKESDHGPSDKKKRKSEQ